MNNLDLLVETWKTALKQTELDKLKKKVKKLKKENKKLRKKIAKTS